MFNRCSKVVPSAKTFRSFNFTASRRISEVKCPSRSQSHPPRPGKKRSNHQRLSFYSSYRRHICSWNKKDNLADKTQASSRSSCPCTCGVVRVFFVRTFVVKGCHWVSACSLQSIFTRRISMHQPIHINSMGLIHHPTNHHSWKLPLPPIQRASAWLWSPIAAINRNELDKRLSLVRCCGCMQVNGMSLGPLVVACRALRHCDSRYMFLFFLGKKKDSSFAKK